MDSCTNQELGRQLTFYELDALSPEDALKIEEHLLVCPYCSSELEAGLGFSKALRANRPALQEYYRQQGAGFDAEVRMFGGNKNPTGNERAKAAVFMGLPSALPRPNAASWSEMVRAIAAKLLSWTRGEKLRWSIVPIAVSVVAITIFFVKPGNTPHLTDSLLSLLPAHALPYNELVVRGGTAADSALEAVMESYARGDYSAVVKPLRAHVARFQDHAQSWIYLGSTEYMLHDFNAASQAFETAQRLASRYVLDANAALYYGASLLQIGKHDSARAVFQGLQKQPNKAVARQAEAILTHLASP
jgi:tetratricopeptide (TPR) repeat protein